MRHVDYREWAEEALGERRQVYARDIREPAGAPLVFMPDREAEQFRADARAGKLVCPVPGCPSPQLTTRGPQQRRHHFVHRDAPADPRHDLTYARQATMGLLRAWIRRQHPKFEVTEHARIRGVEVTLLVRSPLTNRRVALIYVDRRLGADRWDETNAELVKAKLPASWIFALRPAFFALPKSDEACRPE